MRVFIQLMKEFSIPFILSVLWTIYNFYGDESRNEWTVQRFVNTIGPSFFILSWGLAQYFRVKKQTKVEDGFGKMELSFKELMDKLEAKAEETIAHISGGDSYPWIQFCLISSSNAWGLIVMNHGNYPLYDVTARITDLHQLAQANDPSSISTAVFGTMEHIGNLIPSQSNIVFTIDVKDYSELSFNIFFTARNGLFSQLLRVKKINDSWQSAIKVMNKDGDTIREIVAELFPRDADGNVNW